MELIVTLEHVRTTPNFNGQIGFCARGARQWCERHGIDWLTFVREGVPASRLLVLDDALAQRVVEHAKAQCRG